MNLSGYTLNNSDALFGGLHHQPCSPHSDPRPVLREKLLGAVGEPVDLTARRTRVTVEGKRGQPGLEQTRQKTCWDEVGPCADYMRFPTHAISARRTEKELRAYRENVVEAENGCRGPEAWSTTAKAANADASSLHFRRPKRWGRTLVVPPSDPDGNCVPPGNGEYCFGTGHVLNNTPRGEYIQHSHDTPRRAWTAAQLRKAQKTAPLEYKCMVRDMAVAQGKADPGQVAFEKATAAVLAAKRAQNRPGGYAWSDSSRPESKGEPLDQRQQLVGASPWEQARNNAPFGSATGPSTAMVFQASTAKLLEKVFNSDPTVLGKADPAQKAKREKLKQYAKKWSDDTTDAVRLQEVKSALHSVAGRATKVSKERRRQRMVNEAMKAGREGLALTKGGHGVGY